jgi:hypothetical protein
MAVGISTGATRVRMMSAIRPSAVTAEHAIGRRDQPPGKADPFRLAAAEQLVGRMAAQHRRQLPGQIDHVADPSSA